MRTLATVIAAFAASATIAPGAPSLDSPDELPSRQRLNGSETVKAFGPASAEVASSSLSLLLDGKRAALGTVIDAEGYVITKATEIEGEGALKAMTASGTELPVTRIAADPATDLALLKVEPKVALSPVRWGDADSLVQGSWVAAMGTGADNTVMGVVSATRRSIKRRPGVLGVGLDEHDDPNELGVAITEFGPNSPAEDEGFEPGDLIVKIEETAIRSRKELAEEIQKYDPMDAVRIKVQRGEEGIPFVVILNYRSNVFDMVDRNQRMSGATSKRKAGFSDAIQHELPLSPTAMGGPLVDLQGNTVGVNIARADRVTTFALPATVVREVAHRLRASAK